MFRGDHGDRCRGRAHFEASKEIYRLPEKRKIKYPLIDAQALRARVTVTPQEIQDYYRDNEQQYPTPGQIKASHILLKTGEGKKEEDVRKRADAPCEGQVRR